MSKSSNEEQCDVLVRGGGIAGRTLAMLLARDGFNIALVERPTPMDESKDPRAYALNAAAVKLLRDLRVWPKEDACPVYDMQIAGDSGGQLAFSAWRQEVDTLTYIVPAVAIERALDKALDFQSRVQRLNAQENPRLPQTPLVAICEGRDSETRAAFGFKMKASEYGHSSLAARLVCEHGHGHIARQWFSGQDILALLPLTSENDKEVSLVWSVPSARAAELQALSAAEFEAVLREASHGALGELRLKTPVVGWALRFAHAERWIARAHGQTAVLVADAAHAMHPLAGQGLNVGLGDVMELARVLREKETWRSLGDEKMLRPYERARQTAFLKVGGACNALFHIYTGQAAPLKAVRNAGMNVVNAVKPLKRWLVGQASQN
ncbi:FAD-dependent monooxygenase [Saezia sanguinis]|uniref:FAD-dependent monooxygenase n=1 Tax=Saezia sanguinis TaxID=1965230 RepID=UPI0030232186